MLSKCPQKRPEIEKMVPLEPHGLEQEVHPHLFRGCQQFAFGIIDDSFQVPTATSTRGLHKWMRCGRTQADQVSWAPRASSEAEVLLPLLPQPGEACWKGQWTWPGAAARCESPAHIRVRLMPLELMGCQEGRCFPSTPRSCP